MAIEDILKKTKSYRESQERKNQEKKSGQSLLQSALSKEVNRNTGDRIYRPDTSKNTPSKKYPKKIIKP